MPIKNGRKTHKERVFIDKMARTGDKSYAAAAAGYTKPAKEAARNLAKPAVAAAIERKHNDMLFNEILPLALEVHKKILGDDATPAGARVQAVKLAYDRTIGADDPAGGNKEPHEMTADELAEAIKRLEAQAASVARDITPPRETDETTPDASIFD